MITSRRDYLLRIIEEVSLALARVTTLRASRRELDALQSVVGACERLFGLEADKLFQLTPAQHFGMLTENEPSELARERVLLYAALNQEAGLAYAALNSAAMARASFANALRFTPRPHRLRGGGRAGLRPPPSPISRKASRARRSTRICRSCCVRPCDRADPVIAPPRRATCQYFRSLSATTYSIIRIMATPSSVAGIKVVAGKTPRKRRPVATAAQTETTSRAVFINGQVEL